MIDNNIAYLTQYQNEMNKLDYVYDNQYKEEEEIRIFLNGRYTLKTKHYCDTSQTVLEYSVQASMTEIMNFENKVIKTIKSYHGANLFNVIEHINGQVYLIYSIDLYGYSVLNLLTGENNMFVPKESFEDGGETFIWTEILYNKINNIILVKGCYWTMPYGVQIFDFSKPDVLPLNLLFDSYKLEDYEDVEFLKFTEDGACIFSCTTDEGDILEVEITLKRKL